MKNVLLYQILTSAIHGKTIQNRKKSHTFKIIKNNKFKILAFELPDGSYSVSNI